MLKTIFSNFIMPLPLFFGLLILAGLFRKRRRTPGLLFLLAMVWLLAVSTSPLPNMLVRSLEDQYSVFSAGEFNFRGETVHIIVLGGGHANDTRLPANNQLTTTALGRLAEGIRLHRLMPGSVLVTSGWSSSGDITQAEMLARTAILLGVNSSGIAMLTTPKNTMTEALEYKRMFGDTARLVVVTSTIHMPRAMLAFRKAGLDPVAAPTNHIIKMSKKRNLWFWVPSAANIAKVESAWKEYAGIGWYRMGGY